MTISVANVKCSSCDTEYPPSGKVKCDKCDGLLDVNYEGLQNTVDRNILYRTHSMWRYRNLIPIIRKEFIVSLGEGLTPLQNSEKYGASLEIEHLSIKLDYLNPTGSFKDRGNSASVSKLKELGITSAMDDTSGNAGSSLAAYCAKAGIQCTLYVPETAPREKLIQAEMYGSSVKRIGGSRTNVTTAAELAAKTDGIYYASHNTNPFFVEGLKTVAFEIAEDMSWQVPEHIVFPVGGGTLLVGAYRGFEELVELGWIEQAPKLHCIQSEACMPIVEAFRKQVETVIPYSESNTIAGGICIANPARGQQVLESVRKTGGHAVEVSDEAILRHQLLLAKSEGIFAEPTSCAALAGVDRLRRMNIIKEDEQVVVELTGFGLKDTKTAANALEEHRK